VRTSRSLVRPVDPGPQGAKAERGQNLGEPVGTDIDARHINAEAILDDHDENEHGGDDLGERVGFEPTVKFYRRLLLARTEIHNVAPN
jgi:hypothetical protein